MDIVEAIRQEKERRRLENEWWAEQRAKGNVKLRVLPGGRLQRKGQPDVRQKPENSGK
jgi:hypothetical protein